MASKNEKVESIYTHEGGKGKKVSYYEQLKRSVMSCMLWESSFYEGGESIADRIKHLCAKVPDEQVKELAVKAKYEMGIRHTPLWMCVSAGIYEKGFIKKLIRRPDDMLELLSLYWLDGRKPIPKQMKLAFSEKLNEFDKYQLSKYRGLSKSIKLRDIIRLMHPKPVSKERSDIFQSIVDGSISSPDTWESALMKGEDKKQTFERLIAGGKIGSFALLRNLRNMKDSGVSNIRKGLLDMRCNKILPFQFMKSAEYAPEYEDVIEEKMLQSISGFEKLKGKTIILVDVSASMSWALSNSSQINRADAAGGVAIMARELCEECRVLAFGQNVYDIPNRRGFALSSLLKPKNEGTYLGAAIKAINEKLYYDRIIVITDEQSADIIPDPKAKGYMINVSCEKNGVGYYKWMHIDGWSPSVINYILEIENEYNCNN